MFEKYRTFYDQNRNLFHTRWPGLPSHWPRPGVSDQVPQPARYEPYQIIITSLWIGMASASNARLSAAKLSSAQVDANFMRYVTFEISIRLRCAVRDGSTNIINVWRWIYSWVAIKNVIGSTVNFNAFTSSGEHFINVINTDKKTNLQ